MTQNPKSSTLDRIEMLVGSRPVSWHLADRGYTVAERWVMTLGNGGSVFVKVATDNNTTRWIREEAKVYAVVRGEFMPTFLGWDDGEFPILILEDLSEATWAWRWSPDLLQRVIHVLGVVAETTVPEDFPPLTRMVRAFKGWHQLAADPTGFLGLGLVSADWLAAALPSLIAAEERAKLDGESLVHLGTRSDNICFSGNRTLLIDWNWASKGNPEVDLIFLLPSVHVEAGPAPWDVTLSEPELIAMVAGYYANQAHRPPHKQGPARAWRIWQRSSGARPRTSSGSGNAGRSPFSGAEPTR